MEKSKMIDRKSGAAVRVQRIVRPPFKVGQRIQNRFNGDLATVTRHTKRGFKWKLDAAKTFVHPLLGTYETGECYEAGYDHWQAV